MGIEQDYGAVEQEVLHRAGTEANVADMRRRVLSYFRRMGLGESRAQDLTQETLFRVYRQWGSFRGDGSRNAWIAAIASNIYRNHVRESYAARRRGNEVEIASLSEGSHLNLRTGIEMSPFQRLVGKRLMEELKKGLTQLPPKMRRCLLLRAQGFSYSEIGEIETVGIETVKSQLKEGRRRLRAWRRRGVTT